ncbi:toll/interleukin-1 receptor domain-containing protein [Mycobacterium sp.]|uniref:toll/interleukin-1 receptor domain-containing protein n=1 Tax=Mycobacterium sp. TaxID=1785 RepID=UPI003C78EB7E
MAHDVFVSYSHHDKPQADAVCAALEAKGIRCWIAPRDVIPGQEWGAAIVDAIRSSRVMVLMFSSHANASPQIRREVQLAVSAETVLIPFRIEDVAPAQSLEYFLGTPHWLDALTPPLEAHLERLAAAVTSFLAVGEPVRFSASTATSSESSSAPDAELTTNIKPTRGGEQRTEQRIPAWDHPAAKGKTTRHDAPTVPEESGEPDAETLLATNTVSPPGHRDAPKPESSTTTENHRTGLVPPTDAPPTAEGVPFFQRLSRRTKMVLSAGALLVVMVVAVVAVIVGSKSSSGGGKTSPTPTPSAVADPLERLQSLVPKDVFGCKSSPPQNVELAELDCSEWATSTVSAALTFHLFADRNTLETYWNEWDRYLVQPCPGMGPSPQDWHRAATPQRVEGRVACGSIKLLGSADLIPRMAWTIDSELLLGEAEGAAGSGIDPLYQWWMAHYR